MLEKNFYIYYKKIPEKMNKNEYKVIQRLKISFVIENTDGQTDKMIDQMKNEWIDRYTERYR